MRHTPVEPLWTPRKWWYPISMGVFSLAVLTFDIYTARRNWSIWFNGASFSVLLASQILMWVQFLDYRKSFKELDKEIAAKWKELQEAKKRPASPNFFH